jgi:hypothetical protein
MKKASPQPGPGTKGIAPTAPATAGQGGSFGWALVCLVAVLLALFNRSFEYSQVLFSSDGPLGANMAKYAAVPEAYTGMWQDLFWVGGRGGSAFPSLTYAVLWVLKPLGFAKFYAPICILVLGLSVWLCFREMGLRAPVCVLGALAAALNTDFFSYACWGLGTLPLAVAAIFVALAALATPATARPWLRAALAGLAVGMSVMEGFDNGAIFSLYFAAFVLFRSLLEPGSRLAQVRRGIVRVAVVASMAAVIAAQALTVLIGTQIQNVVGMEQDPRTKVQRWTDATQWSLPPLETLRVIIPGLFGYRMDTPDGGQYWGRVGERPGQLARHSGSGVYGGVLVAVVAFWAILQSLRGRQSPFSPAERRMVQFWAVAMLVSLVLAWGHFAPFYQFVYALPYFSTIRNPIKFMHAFHLALVLLFGYGLQLLWRAYLEPATVRGASLVAQLKAWWAAAPAFDRRWTQGLGCALGGSLMGWMLYAASRRDLEAFLQKAVPPPDAAPLIAGFSLTELGWFILFLALAGGVLTLMASGVLGGVRSRWAAVCLGLLLIADFTRANVPWVYYWNWQEKYASNPLLDFLRAKPHEQRVVMFPYRANEQLGLLQQVYHADWIQHPFPFYNIQSLDVVQEPRAASENAAYRDRFFTNGAPGMVRMWQLTNTRFLFGLGGAFADLLNQQFDPVLKRFRLHTPFTLAQAQPGAPIQVVTNAAGPFALIEFTGALPRARLYSQWQVNTNDSETLKMLVDPAFDPGQTVLVAGNAPPPPAPGASTNSPAGSVEFLGYSPKRIDLKVNAAGPSVLLLNDKFDPHWTVSVDGQPQSLLRCNFLMQGVPVPAGAHTVEFRFGLPRTALGISVAALGVGVILLGLVGLDARRQRAGAAAVQK